MPNIDLDGGVNVFGPHGLNNNLQQQQAQAVHTTRTVEGFPREVQGAWQPEGHPDPVGEQGVRGGQGMATVTLPHHNIGLDADTLTGVTYTGETEGLRDTVDDLNTRIDELDASTDDIYQRLDALQEQHERRMSMENTEVTVPEVEERETIISISKTKKTTELVVANSILESISSLVKKG